MGYILSTSKEYLSYIKPCNKVRTEPCFGSIMIKGNSIGILISKQVAQEIGLGENAIIGFDKELNRLYVEPTLMKKEGTVHVSNCGCTVTNYSRQYITITPMLDLCGVKYPKKGRYKAIIAPDKSYVEIDFNCLIKENE